MNDALRDIKAEHASLGSILLDNSVMHEVHSLLEPEDYGSREGLIYRGMSELYMQGDGIDVRTLSAKLVEHGVLEKVGEEFLVELVQSTPHAYQAVQYAKLVKSKSMRRRLYEAGSQIVQDVMDGRKTTEELIQDASESIQGVMLAGTKDTVIDAREEVQEALERIEKRRLYGNPIPGFSTGIPALDEMIGGYQGTHFVIVAGRPGSAKTTSVVNTVEFLSRTTDHVSLFFSLEMRAEELVDKILAIRSSVNSKKIKNSRRLTPDDMTRLHGGVTGIRGATGGILIDDTPIQSMSRIASIARKYAHDPKYKLGPVIIDYVQLIDVVSGRESRAEQMAKVSRGIKILSKTIDKPVIGVCQLNRLAEGRDDHRPMMSDLKESGAWEQDADIVELLYRPDYYDPEDQPGILETIVAKNRHGETGSVFSVFRKKYNQIISLGIRGRPPAFRP